MIKPFEDEADELMTYEMLFACQEFERDPSPRTRELAKAALARSPSVMNTSYFIKWMRRNKHSLWQTKAMIEWEEKINANLYWRWLRRPTLTEEDMEAQDITGSKPA